MRVRRTFRLAMEEDGGERFTVQTTALDLVKAERDGQGSIQQGLRTAHFAALRMRRPGVPVKFDDFCSDLIEFTDITDDNDPDEQEGAGDMDPTQLEG
jgi:hypothetical protein